MNQSRTIILLITFILSGCSLPPKPFIPDPKGNNNYQEAIRYSRKYLNQFMKKTGTVGMAVAVIDSDKVVYSDGFGFADKATERMVSDSTTFMVGSVTKIFTATAIMQLVEQGKVVLDSPITTYLPEFKIKSRFQARPITVRDLLTHESGLPSNILNGFYLGQGSYPGADTMYRMVPALFAEEYAANPPHTYFSYCNIGFSLLGNIVDRVSKRTYSGYIQDSIFARLGMKHSSVGFDDERVSGLFSKGYIKNKEELPFCIRDISAGEIVSSAADLSLFVKMLLAGGTLENRHILNEGTLDRMWTQQNGDVPLDFIQFGLAYWLSNITRIPERIVYHGGDIGPFHAMLMALPDKKLGVITLVNSEQGAEIPAIAGIKLLETFYEAKTGRKLPEPQNPKLPIVKLSGQRLNELSGFYQSIIGPTQAQIKGKDLVFSFFGKTVTLIPHSDSTFSPQYKLFGLIPIPLKMVRDMSIEIHIVGERTIAVVRLSGFIKILAEKIAPETPPKEWLARVGKYTIVNEREIVFANKENKKKNKTQNITLSYNSANKNLSLNGMSIKAISPTEAVTCGIGRNAGETVRVYMENGQEYLWAWGYSLKRSEIKTK
jgi:CubicO group peptidase (beta-lactamase class C family)